MRTNTTPYIPTLLQEFLSVVTRKGQITLPSRMRQHFEIEQGDKVAFSYTKNSDNQLVITLKPIKSIAEMTFGVIAASKQPLDPKKARSIAIEGQVKNIIRKMNKK